MKVQEREVSQQVKLFGRDIQVFKRWDVIRDRVLEESYTDIQSGRVFTNWDDLARHCARSYAQI